MENVLNFFNSNMPVVAGQIISFLLYFTGIIGILLVFSDSIVSLFIRNQKNNRFKNIKGENKKKSKVYRHIEMLLNIGIGKNSPSIVYSFFFITIVIFLIFMLLLSNQSSIIFSIIFSLVFSLIPYGLLLLRLRTFRVEGSLEGEVLVSEVLNQYKINYFNMIEAIDKSIGFLKNAPYSQKLLFRLSLQLKEYQTEEELQDILKEFTFAVDTEWVKMLSNNIYLALEEGVNVTIGLDDILKELKQAKSLYEENKRINSEGFTMVKFLVPILYFATIYTAVNFFDFTIEKFFDYQFNTATGFKFFIVMAVLTVINTVVMMMFKKKKFDF